MEQHDKRRANWAVWLAEEARDHMFPWGPEFWRQRSALQAAGIAFSLFVTLVWVPACGRAHRLGGGAVVVDRL